jgi:hypothetical protein
MAARQPEPDFSDEYVFVTSCSASTCVATVTEGPRPKNPTLPLPPQYTWKGNQWVHIYDWQWDCFVGEGVPKEWSPARSSAFYVPQSDGSLRGTWQTDIFSGACRGTVIMQDRRYVKAPMRSMRVPYRQKRNLTTPFELCEARESLAVSKETAISAGGPTSG